VARKASSKKPAKKPDDSPPRPPKAAKKLITVQNPIDPEGVTWEIELLDIEEQEFLALWNSGNDRIGFNPTERAVYDRTKVVAKIVREIKLRKSLAVDEEE
jgi:hypothetical protein